MKAGVAVPATPLRPCLGEGTYAFALNKPGAHMRDVGEGLRLVCMLDELAHGHAANFGAGDMHRGEGRRRDGGELNIIGANDRHIVADAMCRLDERLQGT